jgi:hypothetical protein
MLALAVVAFAIGVVLGSGGSRSPRYALAESFAAAWARHDYARMYSEIDADARRSTPPSAFAGAVQAALSTATATRLRVAGRARGARGGLVTVPVRVQTRLFGSLALSFALRLSERAGAGPRVAWSPSLSFPGLAPGELLTRRTALPRRAALLARDGSVLAESSPGSATAAGEAVRSSPLGNFASAVLGEVGPARCGPPPGRSWRSPASGSMGCSRRDRRSRW